MQQNCNKYFDYPKLKRLHIYSISTPYPNIYNRPRSRIEYQGSTSRTSHSESSECSYVVNQTNILKIYYYSQNTNSQF